MKCPHCGCVECFAETTVHSETFDMSNVRGEDLYDRAIQEPEYGRETRVLCADCGEELPEEEPVWI